MRIEQSTTPGRVRGISMGEENEGGTANLQLKHLSIDAYTAESARPIIIPLPLTRRHTRAGQRMARVLSYGRCANPVHECAN
jgi:hypothetical protein